MKSHSFYRFALFDVAGALTITATLLIATLASAQLRPATGYNTPTSTSNEKEEGRQSPCAQQSSIWREGFAAGEQHVQSGGALLAVEAIDQRSSAVYPNDFTADILWSTGFESGQVHAIHRQ